MDPSGMPSRDGVVLALTAVRHRVRGRLVEMELDFRAMVEASVGSNADDEHDPEGATVAFERAQLAALIESARRHLDELDAALARRHEGGYGTCEGRGRAIGELRLGARPAARRCIRCAAD